MIIDDFDVVGVPVGPSEADAPLIIDPNAVLAGSISAQLFQAIAGWDTKIVQYCGCVDQGELSQHYPAQVCREATDVLTRPQTLSIAVRKASDHLL